MNMCHDQEPHVGIVSQLHREDQRLGILLWNNIEAKIASKCNCGVGLGASVWKMLQPTIREFHRVVN